ncbi:GntR family transcriptional regulator [Microbacterium sp. gxy059]|uniref:GntR family transcriptional regulator n=1 Tax=Microbacterium sp. gxy059 TaxID=2957199 RepID=UPI003D9924A6
MRGHDRADQVEAQPPRLADTVYERLAEAIVDGTLAPGQRVRDSELAADLGVSRMPVREALQRLEQRGLIEMVASRFTRVTEIPEGAAEESLEFIGYQILAAMRLGFPRLTPADRARAAELTRAIGETAADDPRAGYDLSRDLLYLFADASGNSLFQNLIRDTWLILRRNLHGEFPLFAPWEDLTRFFEKFARNIETNDLAAADREIRDFFQLHIGQAGPAALVAQARVEAEERKAATPRSA